MSDPQQVTVDAAIVIRHLTAQIAEQAVTIATLRARIEQQQAEMVAAALAGPASGGEPNDQGEDPAHDVDA